MLLLEHLRGASNQWQLITAQITRLQKQNKTITTNTDYWLGYLSAFANFTSSNNDREEADINSALDTAMDILQMEAIKTENLYELVVCSLFEEISKLRGTDKYRVDLNRVAESIQDYMIKLTVDQQYLRRKFQVSKQNQIQKKQMKSQIDYPRIKNLEPDLFHRLNPEKNQLQGSKYKEFKTQQNYQMKSTANLGRMVIEPTTYLTSRILKSQFSMEKKEEKKNVWGELISTMYSAVRRYIPNKSKQQKKTQQTEQKQKIQAQKQQAQIVQFECTICCQKVSLNNTCKATCGHILHKNCFIEHFKESVNNKKIPIPCPEEDCATEIQLEDFQHHIPQDLMNKYYEFSLHKYVQQNGENTSWCPTPGCSAIYQFQQGIHIYNCPSCSKSYCIKCKKEPHQGDCKLLDIQPEDKDFFKFTEQSKMRQCLRCKFWVQKNKGCDHITCRCGYQFCFRCGTENVECGCDQNPSFYGDDDDDDEDEQGFQDQDDDEQQQNEQVQRAEEEEEIDDEDLDFELQLQQLFNLEQERLKKTDDTKKEEQ